jgi:hypothetical protein
MSLPDRGKMYLRFAFGMKNFLKETITLEKSKEIIRQRLNDRGKNLLTIVKRTIYENAASPYLKLLKLAGCEYGDFERLVHSAGVEPTLMKLREEGVYLSYEEYKTGREVSRGSKTFRFKESDFDNPFVMGHLETRSGGSRSPGTRTILDFDYLTYGRAVYSLCVLDATRALNNPKILWEPIMPGNGPRQLLTYAKIGQPFMRWFSTVSEKRIRPSLKNRLATGYIVYVGRMCGARMPAPEYVPIDEACRVARVVSETIKRHGNCWVHTAPSNALRICEGAKEKALDISGIKFDVGGEPLTRVKRQEIESAGASVCPRYVFVEGGFVGYGCLNPSAPDDMHLIKDALAVIQHERAVAHAEVSVNAFLFTSLLLCAPKILLNVENGDCGVIEKRKCGCSLEGLGFTEHIQEVRGFDKLSGIGMTFLGSNLVQILEEVLPGKFGGSPIDYQMVEEEDEAGHTRLTVNVNPAVGKIDENRLIQTVLAELGKGKDTGRMMANVWWQANVLRVKRVRPYTTSLGKLLPLHIQKQK